VTEHEHYREFTVWKVGNRPNVQTPPHTLSADQSQREIPSLTPSQVAKGNLHTLDFTRIKDSLRASSKALLEDPTTSLPNALAHQLSIPTTSTVPGSQFAASAKGGIGAIKVGPMGGKGRLMTPEEKKRVVEALTRATTTEEVRRLERMLAEGLVPDAGPEAGVDGGQVNGE
jgi:U2 small nuclear ribonucleoprotein A'